MKLNLGAGLKPLEGYVNVDLMIPEVLKDHYEWLEEDVMDLKGIEDESIEEITAFHLVEHIPEHRINLVLYNWYNKLAPGGRLVVELPDLVKCCINYLQSVTKNDPDDFVAHRLGIIGIFGEPTPTNSYMQHQWGWTPKSLGARLELAGFSAENIKEEPQQTKPEWSNYRDFRLVATK